MKTRFLTWVTLASVGWLLIGNISKGQYRVLGDGYETLADCKAGRESYKDTFNQRLKELRGAGQDSAADAWIRQFGWTITLSCYPSDMSPGFLMEK